MYKVWESAFSVSKSVYTLRGSGLVHMILHRGIIRLTSEDNCQIQVVLLGVWHSNGEGCKVWEGSVSLCAVCLLSGSCEKVRVGLSLQCAGVEVLGVVH
jgi:hypothetical protein